MNGVEKMSKDEKKSSKENKIPVINVKMDTETKKKYETLAYLKKTKLQELTLQLIKDAINENADDIAEVQKIQAKHNKQDNNEKEHEK